jgi:hypothetical protein
MKQSSENVQLIGLLALVLLNLGWTIFLLGERERLKRIHENLNTLLRLAGKGMPASRRHTVSLESGQTERYSEAQGYSHQGIGRRLAP